MNKEETKKYNREYYAKNKIKIRNRNKKWRAENPDKVLQYLINRAEKLTQQIDTKG